MSVFVRPRPIRVVFLVAECEHWPVILDAIFADCYSRWGGRFNLIIPCENNSLRESYLPWLKEYDPDIIYSYADLSDSAVSTIHEDISPSFLVRHEIHNPVEHDLRAFRPDLPLHGLTSLSVLPMAAYGDSWFGHRKTILVDAHPANPPNGFLQDNFGFYRNSLNPWPMGRGMEDYTRTITLVPQEILDDPQMVPKTIGEAVTRDTELMSRIGKEGNLVGLAQVSAWSCPRLEFHDHQWRHTLNVVIGSSFVDRLTFWNARSQMPAWLDRDLVTLNISTTSIERADFIPLLAEIINRRTHITSGSSSPGYVTLRSATLQIDELNDVKERLKAGKVWHFLTCKPIDSLDDCVPTPEVLQNASRYTERDSAFIRSQWNEVTYHGESFRPPALMPRHLREVSPLPSVVRQGLWAVDIDIPRSNDYSRYSNVTHSWRLPHRLRMVEAFARGYHIPGQGGICIPRVTGEGLLGLFAAVDAELPEIQVPSDETVFRVGLCTPRNPWPFERAKDSQAPPVAFEIRASDKGRYLKALLHRSGGLQQAEEIFLGRFWKEQFDRSGGTAASTDARINLVIQTLKKRLKRGTIESEGDWNRLARVVMAEARVVRFANRFLRYDLLQTEFESFRNSFWEHNQYVAPRAEWDAAEKRSLSESLKHLCAQEILHQGHEWKCTQCYSKNWLSIDSLRRSMECATCGGSEPAPVDNVWYFKLDSFILEGLREHGLLAYIWCLSKLRSLARKSFFFLEPHDVFFEKADFDEHRNSTEIDLLVVTDGTVRLCEVKSSSGNIDVDRFGKAALRIRPNVATIAVMEARSKALDAAIARLKVIVNGAGITTELLTLNPGDIDDGPNLPCGRSYRVRLF